MILVVAAMESEIKEIIKHPFDHTTIILTGVGKVNAAMTLSDMLAKNHVDAIYNFGFAGATAHYQVGDIVAIKEARYHDFDLTMFGYVHGQVPGYPTCFISDSTLLEHAVKQVSGLKIGNLYTGDYFMTSATEEKCLVDMEATALFHVAYKHQIPILSIKIVSDVIGMDDHVNAYKKFEAAVGAHQLDDIYKKIFSEVSI